MKLDEKDKRVILILKEDSSLTVSQISKKSKIPITTVHNRIKRLKENGIIKNYTINLDHEKIGKPIKSYILVTVNQNKSHPQEEIAEKISKIEDVISTDIVTGQTDILSVVKTDSIKNLNEIITHKIRNIEGVDKTQTIIVLNEMN
ncbi:MAG: Lrp/AsnC family transcriptional regulator [archaeon]|nr:Lrp/AsnC family transcriptional regulator [archaeon]